MVFRGLLERLECENIIAGRQLQWNDKKILRIGKKYKQGPKFYEVFLRVCHFTRLISLFFTKNSEE